MALGGGKFVLQNKILPGSYINIVSAAAASAAASDRGVAAVGIPLDWGSADGIIELTSADIQKNSLKILGCAYTDDKIKYLREMFANAVKVYAYRLNGADAKAASNNLAAAKYSGTRGNDITIIVAANVDDETKFDVSTILGSDTVDTQTVKTASELVGNDFVEFKKDAEITVTAGMPLTGGANGEVTTAEHQTFLDKIEKYSFNALCCASTDDKIKGLYVNYTKRLRDEVGKKFQTVVYNYPADYEGIVNVKNKPSDSENEADLTYWVTGVVAGTAVNKSALNLKYNGEFKPCVDYSQSQLEQAIQNGEFTLHQVGDDIRVLNDINSLVTVSDNKGDIFKDNQTIRVIDQIANDIAVLFNTRYLGVVPNDKSGRVSLWNDIVTHHRQLEQIRAIEDFSGDDVVVEQGNSKKSVVVTDAVTVVNAMEKLYMTVTVS